MEIIAIIFIIVIFLLVLSLFLFKQEVKRITSELKMIRSSSTNALVHTEHFSKIFQNEIEEINSLLTEKRYEQQHYEKKKEELKNMMTNISHDLRTPLTSALGYMDLILNSNQNDNKNELRIVLERLKRLEELIETFFELSKMEERILLEDVNVIGILEECISHYYEDFKQENREVLFFKDARKMMIFSNSVMLSRVFDNLISNSFKHSNGNLTIKLSKKEKVEIIFTNLLLNPELEIEKIFDQFYTVDISRTNGNTGLGLAIAKEFIEALNGTISASKANQDLVIKIEI